MSRILIGLLLIVGSAPFCIAQDAAAPPAQDGAAPAGEQATDAATSEQGADQTAPGDDATGEPAAGVAAAGEPPAGEATPESDAPAPSAEAKAASDAFEALVKEWDGLIEQLKALQQQRDAAQGEARAKLEAQMDEMRKQTGAQLDKIAAAGLAAYKLDPLAFPRVNATLMVILQFLVIGDAHGDGGDQYEKAFPLAKELIDAGAGEKLPQIYLFGGVSAYSIAELDLAEDYLTKAEKAGLFAGVPEQMGGEPPSLKVFQDAQQYLATLPKHRKDWEAEQKIRAAEAQADDLPRVKLTTTKGDIVLELFENEAPQAVANFITLAKKGFYDGVTFHRVLPLFMAQGGDPEGTGNGGPGYNLRDEYGAPNARKHFRGSLAMARSQAPNSSGSQFYITFVPTSGLDGGYTVFGRVLEGVDVAAALKRRDPNAPGPKPIPDKIIKAEVLRDRGHAYDFEKLP